ncbi:MAG: Hsp20/alpha crystallin family protein [Mycobacteriales bacterium]
MTALPVKKTTPFAPAPFFNAFAPLQREIDRVFEDFTPGFWTGARLADVHCKMNLAETKTGFELTFELPGLEEKDVNVEIADGVLTVSGEKTFDTERKDKTYRTVERGYGAFSRSVELPAGARPDQIKAELAKGVLTVTVPTAPKAEPKKIAISATA